MYSFAQNGSGNLHIFNDNTNHSLDLNFTLFTIVPSTCSTSIQGIPSRLPLTAGGVADYTTFAGAASTATPLNPYPFDTCTQAEHMFLQVGFHLLYKHNLDGIT